MINERYFRETTQELINILDSSNLIEKEIKDKKKKIKKRLNNMINAQEIHNDYTSLAHEIKSYNFLRKYGNLKMARDTNSETGPDFKLNRYQIECVCCSSGDTQINGLEEHRLSENRKSIVMDYNKLLEILLPRITQELVEKSKKLKEYIYNRNNKKE